MLQTLFTKIVLHTKLLISGVLLSVSSYFGLTNVDVLDDSLATPSPTPILEKTKKETVASTKPTSTPSYYDLHCPEIIEIKDSINNISNRTTNRNRINGSFKKGEISTLRLTVQAKDPMNLPLYYRFDSLGLENTDKNSITSKDWSKDNFIDLNVSNAIPGITRYISVAVDNRDGYSCYGSYDLYESATYEVTQ